MSRNDSRPASLGKLSLVLALAFVCSAPAAVAEIYHVRLENGQRIESRYPPEEASWDSGMLILHSETGNWVGVPRAEVLEITIETELRGHGQRIDATTIFMGRTANAAPIQTDEDVDPTTQLLRSIYEQGQQQQNHTIEQFVEPDATGGGIPVGFTQQVTPPIGVPVPNR